MKLRFFLAGVLASAVLLNADQVTSVFAIILGQHTFTQPLGSGAANANISINAGGTAFSQGGLIFCMGGSGSTCTGGTQESGWFQDLQTGLPNSFLAQYDYIDGVDRIESYNGSNGQLNLQPATGFVAVGAIKSSTPPAALGVVGSAWHFDPTSVASESLTNPTFSSSGTSWTSTNDCSFGATSAICTFSAGTASTISQASGTLAIPGKGIRMYRYLYTVSGLTGTPSASITSAFANTIGSAALANLDLSSTGAKTTYFQSVAGPGNFTITTTLTTGQAFTLTSTSLKEITGGNSYAGNQAYSVAYQWQDPILVGSLPSCAASTLGVRRMVSDATLATPGSTAVGSGTYTIAVQCTFNSTGSAYTWIID